MSVQAIELDSKYSLGYTLKGSLLMSSGKPEQAVTCFFQAHAIRKVLILLDGWKHLRGCFFKKNFFFYRRTFTRIGGWWMPILRAKNIARPHLLPKRLTEVCPRGACVCFSLASSCDAAFLTPPIISAHALTLYGRVLCSFGGDETAAAGRAKKDRIDKAQKVFREVSLLEMGGIL
jgi:hypothetical protein